MMLFLPTQKPFFFTILVPFGCQFKECLRVLGKENSLCALKPVFNCLCLKKFELKQTLDKYDKKCVAWKGQDFLFYHPTAWKDTFVPPFDYLVTIIEVCGLKFNTISKLINHRRKRKPDQSNRKLTACPINALSA